MTELLSRPERPVVLVTGFGPFPGVAVNATALLLPRIARRIRSLRPSAAVRAVALPTEWDRGRLRARAAIVRHRPDVVVHFGVSSKAEGFVLETEGTSACRLSPDAVGVLPGADVVDRVPATFPFGTVQARLVSLGLPVELSDDAGSYLCNAVLYQTLSLPPPIRPSVAGFIHIPSALAGEGDDGRRPAATSPLSQAEAIEGAAAIVAACLESIAG